MNFGSSINGDSLFDKLKLIVYDCKIEEISRARSLLIDGELEEALDEIESDYTFNLFKLDEVAELESSSLENQKKFIEMYLHIKDLDIGRKSKTQVILTSACILNKVNTRTQDLNKEQFLLLATTMVPIPLDEYSVYGDILSNPALLTSVSTKTDDLTEQVNMMDSVMDYCDSFAYEGMSDIDYKKSVSDSIKLIAQYQVKPKEKVK